MDLAWFFCVQLDDERVTVLQTVAPTFLEAHKKLLARSGEPEWPMEGRSIREVLFPTYEKYLAGELLIT